MELLPQSRLRAGQHHINYIILDSGSTDSCVLSRRSLGLTFPEPESFYSGPQKLALGHTTCPRDAYVRDLEPLLRASHQHHIPVLLGSAGGDGSNIHVDLFVELVQEISAKEGYSFSVAAIYTDVDRQLVVDGIEAGMVHPCGAAPDLTVEEARAATTIVAQMGAEPFMEALKAGADIIIGGEQLFLVTDHLRSLKLTRSSSMQVGPTIPPRTLLFAFSEA